MEEVQFKQVNCVKSHQKFFCSNDVMSIVHVSQTHVSCLFLTVATWHMLSHLLLCAANPEDMVGVCRRISSLDSSFHLPGVTEIV